MQITEYLDSNIKIFKEMNTTLKNMESKIDILLKLLKT